MNLPNKIITYLYRTNTPKNIVVELHDDAVQLDNDAINFATHAAKSARETAELRALLVKIHDEATPAPGGYLLTGEVMREIAEVL